MKANDIFIFVRIDMEHHIKNEVINVANECSRSLEVEPLMLLILIVCARVRSLHADGGL